MQYQQIIITVGSLAVVLPLVWIAIRYYEKRQIQNANTSLFIKKSKSNSFYLIYQFFLWFPLTRGSFHKLSQRYEIICPDDPRKIASKTMTTAFYVFLLWCAEIYIIFIIKPSLHNGAIALFLSFVIVNEIISYSLGSAELKLLESMEVFVSDVDHNYYIRQLVDDAILMSMDGQTPEMKIHAQRLYDVVISTNMKEDVIKYNASMHNRYLKMFLSLCASVIEHNDKKVNGHLLFTSNLIHLKSEINIEILRLQKLRYIFAGSVFTAVAVCLPIDAIQRFGISMVPALETFYTGQGGSILVTIILLSSAIIYVLINNAKEASRPLPRDFRFLKRLERIPIIKRALDNYTEKYYSKMENMKETLKKLGENISPRQLLLKRMITGLVVFAVCIGGAFYVHGASKKLLLSKVTNIESISATGSIKQQQLMSETILRFTNLHKNDRVSIDQLLEELTLDGTFYNTKTKEILSEEIASRISKYQNEYFKWYELVACFAAAVGGFYAPYLMILFRMRVIRFIMEDEVNQFHSIIYMMMYIDHVTIRDILEQMELFAVVFKQAIQECLNEYNSGDIEALTKMMENESFGPFKRLVGNLIRCDMIPIPKAFSEIASDRENYRDKRKQQNEISIQRRADIVKPMSFIPAVFVTIYLMLPMLVAGLKMLEEFQESIASLGY